MQSAPIPTLTSREIGGLVADPGRLIIPYTGQLADDDKIWTIQIAPSVVRSCLKNLMISPTQFVADCFPSASAVPVIDWKAGEPSIAILFLYASRSATDYVIQGISGTSMINVYCPRKKNVKRWDLPSSAVLQSAAPRPSKRFESDPPIPAPAPAPLGKKANPPGPTRIHRAMNASALMQAPPDLRPLNAIPMPFCSMQYLPVTDATGLAFAHYDPKDADTSANMSYEKMTDILIDIIMNPLSVANTFNATEKRIDYSPITAAVVGADMSSVTNSLPIFHYGSQAESMNNMNNLRLIYQVPKDFANQQYKIDKSSYPSEKMGVRSSVVGRSAPVPAGSQCLKISGSYSIVPGNGGNLSYIVIDGMMYNVW